MDINHKRLILLVRFLDVALFLIIISGLYLISRIWPSINKFSGLADQLPQSQRFLEIRNFYNVIGYFAVIKVIVSRGFFGIVIYQIRKVVSSVLHTGAFNLTQAKMIRKLAMLFLIVAGALLFFNFIFLLAALNKNREFVMAAVNGFFSILENYVVGAVVAFVLAEIFNAGIRLKQENELSI